MKKIAANKNYRLRKKALVTIGPHAGPGPKVWVVMKNVDHEGSRIEGIYSSEEKAKAVATDKEATKNPNKGGGLDEYGEEIYDYSDVHFSIKEYMVQ